MRYYRTTGLMITQMQELVRRVNEALDEPWNKCTGRPEIAWAVQGGRGSVHVPPAECNAGIHRGYAGHVAAHHFPLRGSPGTTREIGARGVRAGTLAEAIEMARGRVVLVDGTLTPCWSYEEHRELWNKKHKTTGFNAQLISLLDGNAVWVSGPLPGKTHDAKAFKETGAADIVKESGGGFGDKGYQGTGLVTPREEAEGRRAVDVRQGI